MNKTILTISLCLLIYSHAGSKETTTNQWDTYFVGNIEFMNEAPDTQGAEIYAE